MSRSMKIWFVVAAALVLIGGIMFCGVMMSHDWSFEKYVNNTYNIEEGFGDIIVKSSTADIEILKSEDGQCKIVCDEKEKIKHTVAVNEGVLNITENDTRAWYDYISLFSFRSPKITVYLPSVGYNNLNVELSTGNVEVAEDFRFESINISGSTGDTTCLASALGAVKLTRSTGNIVFNANLAGSLELSTSTGNISISSVGCSGDVKIGVTTGDVKADDIICYNFKTNGSTGNVTLNDVIAKGNFDIKHTTGDVTLNRCNSYELFIETSTGNVIGTLLGEKIFLVDTGTGDKSVPQTTNGGRCVVKTSTGNIKFEIV